MKKIRIITKTEIGEKAIEQHVAESLKLKWRERIMFKKMGFSQKIISHNPTVLQLELNNSRLSHIIKPEHFCLQIESSLKDNGASKDIDYFLEVE